MEVSKRSVVRGYHVYKDVWTAAIGEELVCKRERGNSHDIYAVAVKKDGAVVGHLPRKIARVSSLFLRRGGTIRCKVLGARQYSADLEQGGLEIPCLLLFKGTQNEITKLSALLDRY